MMANNSFAKRCFVDGELWSNATYNTSSSTRKSAMCNFETMPVLCAYLHKCTGEGSWHFSAFHCISICILLYGIIKLSKMADFKLQLLNMCNNILLLCMAILIGILLIGNTNYSLCYLVHGKYSL